MRAVRRKGLFSYYEAYAAEIFGHRKIIVCGSKRKGAIPTFSGGYHRLFPQKEMGVIYKNETVSTLLPKSGIL